MLGFKLVKTPIESNHKLQAGTGEPIDIGKYQIFVGRLIYLSHALLNITHM